MNAESPSSISFRIGHSMLEFSQGLPAYYHFALNIPSDAISEAAVWLQDLGLTLLPMEGSVVIPFPNWQAEAVYFHDPAGNIVELISRKRLGLRGSGEFGSNCLIGISEIGFATYAPADVRTRLEAEMDLDRFWCSEDRFCALGDEQGLFILVDAGHKRWIPCMEEALPFPFSAAVSSGSRSWKVSWDNTELVLEEANL